MKSKITTKCAAILMSALIGASSCAIPAFAATTANDDCINPSAISSIFNNNNQDSGTVLTRRPEDIKPMSYDYVVDNIDKLVTGLHDKGVVFNSTGIDLTSDIKIIDPRIVYVKADYSKVDLSKRGLYPVHFQIAYKPISSENPVSRSKFSDIIESGDGSANYRYTNLAQTLQNNEYAVVNLNSVVSVADESYWNAVLTKDYYVRNHIVKTSTYIYSSNMKRLDSNPKINITKSYPNLTGNIIEKSAKVTAPFSYAIGADGCFCGKCGTLFTSNEWGTRSNAAVSAHENQDKSNWVTCTPEHHTYHVGDSVNFLIFQSQI